MWRKLRELLAYLIKRESDPLREHDERDATEHVTRVVPLTPTLTLRPDQPTLFIESKR